MLAEDEAYKVDLQTLTKVRFSHLAAASSGVEGDVDHAAWIDHKQGASRQEFTKASPEFVDH